jgi:hypothetical protein
LLAVTSIPSLLLWAAFLFRRSKILPSLYLWTGSICIGLIILAASRFFITPEHLKGASRDYKTEFVKAFIVGCIQKQSADDLNKAFNITSAQIEAYCACAADKVLAVSSATDIALAAVGLPPEQVTNNLAAAGAQCSATTLMPPQQ